MRKASAQLADFTHTCFMVTPYEGYVAVAEALAELTPGDHAKKSALFNSGAEAVENAVKIARAYTKRQAVVVFDHGYHGRTNLTMALTAKNMPYKHGFGPFAPEVYRVPVAYGYRWPTGAENAGPEAAAQAIDQIAKQVGAENVAAIIIEPVLRRGAASSSRPRGFPPAISQFAQDNGIVFVADEIQSGFCRTGQWLPARTRASSRTRSPRPRASRAVCRPPPSPAAPRSWTPRTPAAFAAPTAATRWPARARSAPSRRCGS